MFNDGLSFPWNTVFWANQICSDQLTSTRPWRGWVVGGGQKNFDPIGFLKFNLDMKNGSTIPLLDRMTVITCQSGGKLHARAHAHTLSWDWVKSRQNVVTSSTLLSRIQAAHSASCCHHGIMTLIKEHWAERSRGVGWGWVRWVRIYNNSTAKVLGRWIHLLCLPLLVW